MLVLTGDQIYADDVSISLLSMLRQQAAGLFTQAEQLPVEFKNSGDKTLDPQKLPLHCRKQVLKDGQSGFSSSRSDNHLLSFAEYAAMYLYILGNAEQWAVNTDWEALSQECGDHIDEAKKAFDEQLEAVTLFQSTLPKVRRLLANIPTYMIFDDHEVTDDWNITSLWYDEVRDSALGRRVVANALAAYWAFQGWGNDPDNFDKELKRSIRGHLLNNKAVGESAERFDLHTWKHRGWGYSVPVNPPIIALDSRTQRDSLPDSYLPLLLDRYALDWLRLEWLKLKNTLEITEETCPVIISAVPVLGFSVVTNLQKWTLLIAGMVDRYKWIKTIEMLLGEKGFLTRKLVRAIDAESWTSNPQGFLNLMNCLLTKMHLRQCTFLSGDTHYSFSAVAKYSEKDEVALYCYQLTSSSLKNCPSDFQISALEAAGGFKAKTTRFSNLLKQLNPFKSWEAKVHLLPDEERIYVSGHCNLGMVVFKQGRPVSNTLLQQEAESVCQLPELTFIDKL